MLRKKGSEVVDGGLVVVAGGDVPAGGDGLLELHDRDSFWAGGYQWRAVDCCALGLTEEGSTSADWSAHPRPYPVNASGAGPVPSSPAPFITSFRSGGWRLAYVFEQAGNAVHAFERHGHLDGYRLKSSERQAARQTVPSCDGTDRVRWSSKTTRDAVPVACPIQWSVGVNSGKSQPGRRALPRRSILLRGGAASAVVSQRSRPGMT